jgi:formylglycine-generating enzyme required for sulfatase activity
VYTVTYYANGGTGMVPSWSVNPGESVTISAGSGLSKSSHAVDGWSTSADGAGTAYQAGASYTPQADITLYAQWVFSTFYMAKDMVTIPGMTVVGNNAWSGPYPGEATFAFPTGRTVTLSTYQIARYETTYELWYTVRQWALAQGYVFFRPGVEGRWEAPEELVEKEGAPPTEAGKTLPATYMSWWDVVVWCNAYSLMEGREPVYYFDTAYTALITTVPVPMHEENVRYETLVYMKSGANGYRLPTDAEWEAAGRGGDPSSPAWAYKCAGSDTPGNVAWYAGNSGGQPHPVGQKQPNTAGLYDMSGNVEEWCFDWHNGIPPSGTVTNPTGSLNGYSKIKRNGDYKTVYEDVLWMYYSFPHDPGDGDNRLGFRVACWE